MRASENKPAVEEAPEDAAAGNVVAPVGSPVDVVSTTTVSVSNNLDRSSAAPLTSG